MNQSLLFIFYLLSFLIGSSALFLSLFLYIENKSGFIKYFVLLLLVEFFNNFSNLLLLFYKINNIVYINSIAAISSFFEFIILGALLSVLTKTPFSNLKKSIIAIILFGASASIVAENLIKDNPLLFFIRNINFLFYVIVSYYIYIAVKGFFKEKNSDLRLVLSIIIAAFAFAVPLAIIREISFTNIPYLNHLEDSVTYFIINIGGFILFFRKISLKLEIRKETENNESTKNNVTIPAVDTAFTGEKSPIGQFGLTSRELEIALLIMDGLTNQDIADKLYISIKTVKTHIYNIYQKLDIKNRTELIFKFKI